MLDWHTIVRGAALSAVAAGVLVGLARRERRLAAALAAAVAAFIGPVAWNAVLRATHANEFFTDASVDRFPASWQDAGSGVFTVAVATVVVGWLTHPGYSGRYNASMAVLAGLAAFLVDVYWY